jgi:hypothetical protein
MMLREINPEEAIRLAWAGKSVLAVNVEDPQLTDWVWFSEKLRSCRFLIEKEAKEAPEEPEDDQDPEDVLLKQPPKRRRRSPAEIEEAVLKAWNRGERSITQIMEMSRCSYKQVRKYIPETKEG